MKKLINIKQEVLEQNLIIATADRGHTLMIMPKNKYDRKAVKSVIENSYTESGHSPTEQHQRAVSYNLNENG
jgi:alkaline phosphatase